MRSCILSTAFLVALVPLAPLSSQTVQPKSGDRIRVTAAPNTLYHRTALLLSIRSDTLLLRVAPAETLAVALRGVTRLEVSTGRRPLILRGAGIGAAAGFTSGAFLGYASGDDKSRFFAFTAKEKAVIYGVGLGAVGLVVGTVVGFFNFTDRWTSVDLGESGPSPRLHVDVAGHRLGVAVSF
ncbi:MAG TPA: hypothetical protein VM076_13040 [Gemmatimonadaceae bacterium]|nr:hypothetical protein [Gemmatimonadaceae bacterium]